MGWGIDSDLIGVVAAHPWHKNKGVPGMGHPGIRLAFVRSLLCRPGNAPGFRNRAQQPSSGKREHLRVHTKNELRPGLFRIGFFVPNEFNHGVHGAGPVWRGCIVMDEVAAGRHVVPGQVLGVRSCRIENHVNVRQAERTALAAYFLRSIFNFALYEFDIGKTQGPGRGLDSGKARMGKSLGNWRTRRQASALRR